MKLIIWAAISERTEKGRGRFREILRNWMLKFADAVWVNGKSGARYIQGLGFPGEKIFPVPYTIDNTRFHRVLSSGAGPKAGSLRVLISGQLVERKGILPFINTLKIWAEAHPQKHIEVWLLGEGLLRESIATFAAPEQLSIKLLGSVPYADLPGYYHQADFFAFPTLADEWGVVVNEAMAAGLPVIGSVYSQGAEELVLDGKTGWLFCPDDLQQTLHVFDQAFSASAEVLVQMGKLGQEREASMGVPYAVSQMLKSL